MSHFHVAPKVPHSSWVGFHPASQAAPSHSPLLIPPISPLSKQWGAPGQGSVGTLPFSVYIYSLAHQPHSVSGLKISPKQQLYFHFQSDFSPQLQTCIYPGALESLLCLIFSHTPYPIMYQILVVLPLKYTWKLSRTHHLPLKLCNSFLTGPASTLAPLQTILHREDIVILVKPSQIMSPLCSELSTGTSVTVVYVVYDLSPMTLHPNSVPKLLALSFPLLTDSHLASLLFLQHIRLSWVFLPLYLQFSLPGTVLP